ncbi:type III secretion system protein SctP [Paraburkholderia fungorum]|uniref:type III secretion system protein SctP n=1 Tax=Paraburkholderia fungorum TaxID=134537 RepID=UPI0038BA2151
MIESRSLRIIPGDMAAEQKADDARVRAFDYAGLARRTRMQRLAARSHDTGSGHVAGDNDESGGGRPRMFESHDDEKRDDSADQAADISDQAAASQREAVAQRVCGATLPVVDALFRTQGQFLELATSLANEVTAFCSDPAIGNAGNWEVQMPLDKAVLPDTTLYLSLSCFRLSLRFDTSSMETKQLLLNHSAMLEREIDSLLKAWGAPRDIELTVW